MNDDNSGYLYCLSNQGMPGIYKIGKTNKDPLIRIKHLYNTSTPFPFKIEFCKKVINVSDKEKLLHSLLEHHNYRCNPNREFFELDIDVIKAYFDLIDGEYYTKHQINGDIIDEENMEDLEDLKLTGCRDPSKCFTNNHKLRHRIGINDIWYFIYDKLNKVFIYDTNTYSSMYKITKMHYQTSKPERSSENNAWKECECLINGKWISTYNLAPL